MWGRSDVITTLKTAKDKECDISEKRLWFLKNNVVEAGVPSAAPCRPNCVTALCCSYQVAELPPPGAQGPRVPEESRGEEASLGVTHTHTHAHTICSEGVARWPK